MTDPLSYIKTPPTDSLYKFMAIAGFIVALVTGIAYQYANYKLFQKREELWQDSTIVYEKKEMFRTTNRLCDSLIHKNDSLIKIKNQDKRVIKILIQYNKQLDSLKMAYLDKNEVSDSLYFSYQHKFAERNVLLYLIKMYSDIAWYLFAIGIISMLSGFIFWYIKVQYYLDLILEAEAERMVSDNRKKYLRKIKFDINRDAQIPVVIERLN